MNKLINAIRKDLFMFTWIEIPKILSELLGCFKSFVRFNIMCFCSHILINIYSTVSDREFCTLYIDAVQFSKF